MSVELVCARGDELDNVMWSRRRPLHSVVDLTPYATGLSDRVCDVKQNVRHRLACDYDIILGCT